MSLANLSVAPQVHSPSTRRVGNSLLLLPSVAPGAGAAAHSIGRRHRVGVLEGGQHLAQALQDHRKAGAAGRVIVPALLGQRGVCRGHTCTWCMCVRACVRVWTCERMCACATPYQKPAQACLYLARALDLHTQKNVQSLGRVGRSVPRAEETRTWLSVQKGS